MLIGSLRWHYPDRFDGYDLSPHAASTPALEACRTQRKRSSSASRVGASAKSGRQQTTKPGRRARAEYRTSAMSAQSSGKRGECSRPSPLPAPGYEFRATTRRTGIGTLQPVADDAAYGRRCPKPPFLAAAEIGSAGKHSSANVRAWRDSPNMRDSFIGKRSTCTPRRR
jgi:hypothetical protein